MSRCDTHTHSPCAQYSDMTTFWITIRSGDHAWLVRCSSCGTRGPTRCCWPRSLAARCRACRRSAGPQRDAADGSEWSSWLCCEAAAAVAAGEAPGLRSCEPTIARQANSTNAKSRTRRYPRVAPAPIATPCSPKSGSRLPPCPVGLLEPLRPSPQSTSPCSIVLGVALCFWRACCCCCCCCLCGDIGGLCGCV